VVHRDERDELLQRVDQVAGKLGLKRGDHGIGIGRVVHLDENLADLAGVAGEVLEDLNRDYDAGQLAFLDDPPGGCLLIRLAGEAKNDLGVANGKAAFADAGLD